MKEIRVIPQLCFNRGFVDLVSEQNTHTPLGALIEKGIVLKRIKRASLDDLDRPLRVVPYYDKNGNLMFKAVLKSGR